MTAQVRFLQAQPDNWLTIAEQVAGQLRRDAAERDRKAEPPRNEVNLLRESGLLSALNTAEAGGGGISFTNAFRIVRIIARADTSVAQLLSYHYLLSHSALWQSLPEQRKQLEFRSVDEKWFWGGASNPRDALPLLTDDGDGFRLNGRKTFASNAALADRITLRVAYNDVVLLLAIPGKNPDIVHGNDWNAFGQKLTESGSVTFKNVRVERDHVIGPLPRQRNYKPPARATLIVPIHQLLFVNFYLGTAEGALLEAKDYLHRAARPWQTSGVAKASLDPYVLEHYGTLSANLQASVALAEAAAREVEHAISRGDDLTPAERTAAAATIYAAKVNSTHVALDVTSRFLDLLGARATAGHYGFDRFWRNVRTHSLHDPVAYKAREVGNYALHGEITSDPLYT